MKNQIKGKRKKKDKILKRLREKMRNAQYQLSRFSICNSSSWKKKKKKKKPKQRNTTNVINNMPNNVGIF